jgi:hypothetical protein
MPSLNHTIALTSTSKHSLVDEPKANALAASVASQAPL